MPEASRGTRWLGWRLPPASEPERTPPRLMMQRLRCRLRWGYNIGFLTIPYYSSYTRTNVLSRGFAKFLPGRKLFCASPGLGTPAGRAPPHRLEHTLPPPAREKALFYKKTIKKARQAALWGWCFGSTAQKFCAGCTRVRHRFPPSMVSSGGQILRRLGPPLFLALGRKNILCNLLLVRLGHSDEPAPVFKFARVFLDDADNLRKKRRLWPVLQQPDL